MQALQGRLRPSAEGWLHRPAPACFHRQPRAYQPFSRSQASQPAEPPCQSAHRQHHRQQRCRQSLQRVHSLPVPEDWGDFDALTQQLEELADEVQEMLQGASLYLVGMMGSGKSKVGRVLSSFLGYPFLDTDELIEELTKQKISAIFAQDGEEAFREMETQILQEVMPIKSCIVSTGGGIVLRNENWSMMSHAVVIWLHGETGLLARRVVADGRESRPLLADEQGEETTSTVDVQDHAEYERTVQRLDKILAERRERYALADLRVDVDGAQPLEHEEGAPVMGVVLRVLQALEKRLREDREAKELQQQFEIKGPGDVPNLNVIPARSNGAYGQ